MLMLSGEDENKIQFNIDWLEFRVDYSEDFINDLNNGFLKSSLVNLEVDIFFGLSDPPLLGQSFKSKSINELRVVSIVPNIKYKINNLVEVYIKDKKYIPNVGLVHRIILKIINKTLYNDDNFIEAISLVRNIVSEYNLSKVELYKIDFDIDFNGFERDILDDNKFRLLKYKEADKKLEFRLDGGTLYVNKKSYKYSYPAVSRLYDKSAELINKPVKSYQVNNFAHIKSNIFRLELVIDRKFSLEEDKILLNSLGEYLLNGSLEDFILNKNPLIYYIFKKMEYRYRINDLRGRMVFGLKNIVSLVNYKEELDNLFINNFISRLEEVGSDYIKSIKKRPIKMDLDFKLEDYKIWLEDFNKIFSEDIIKCIFDDKIFIDKLWIDLSIKFNINEYNIVDLSNKRLNLKNDISRVVHNLICNKFIEKSDQKLINKDIDLFNEDLMINFGGEVIDNKQTRPDLKDYSIEDDFKDFFGFKP